VSDRRSRILRWIAAWDRAAETHRLERTFAENYKPRKLHMLAEVLLELEASCRSRAAYWTGFVSALDTLEAEWSGFINRAPSASDTVSGGQ
jgi:hypothetical protein